MIGALYFEGRILDSFTCGVSINGHGMRLAVLIRKPIETIEPEDIIDAAEELQESARRVQAAVRRRR